MSTTGMGRTVDPFAGPTVPHSMFRRPRSFLDGSARKHQKVITGLDTRQYQPVLGGFATCGFALPGHRLDRFISVHTE